jgi:hypothetical protein
MATAQIEHRRLPMLDLGVNKQQPIFFLNHHNHHPRRRPSTTPPIVAASPSPPTTSTRLYATRTTQKRHVSSRQGNGNTPGRPEVTTMTWHVR